MIRDYFKTSWRNHKKQRLQFAEYSAWPLAFYFLQDWLQKYEYRISIGPGVFIIAAVMALVITMITISFQAIKAAMTNPVKNLRSE